MTMEIRHSEIERVARLEFNEELKREHIEKCKARLREQHGQSLFRRLFPWRITIERRFQ